MFVVRHQPFRPPWFWLRSYPANCTVTSLGLLGLHKGFQGITCSSQSLASFRCVRHYWFEVSCSGFYSATTSAAALRSHVFAVAIAVLFPCYARGKNSSTPQAVLCVIHEVPPSKFSIPQKGGQSQIRYPLSSALGKIWRQLSRRSDKHSFLGDRPLCVCRGESLGQPRAKLCNGQLDHAATLTTLGLCYAVS
jgi:hypothetical protein